MAINFVDRVPTYANRMKITPESGTAYYATVERADSPITNGTPLSAETFNTMQEGLESQIAANMPKSGGVFTGYVQADSTKRAGSYLRNIVVRADSVDGAQQSTVSIIMVRK